jgi:hypothetical protein
MANAKVSATKKVGRPATGMGHPVQVRFPASQLDAVDAWIGHQPLGLSRPEAIRRLVDMGLKGQ